MHFKRAFNKEHLVPVGMAAAGAVATGFLQAMPIPSQISAWVGPNIRDFGLVTVGVLLTTAHGELKMFGVGIGAAAGASLISRNLWSPGS